MVFFQVHSVGWNCDGRRLASGSFDKSVAIFSLDRDRLVCLTFCCIILKHFITNDISLFLF